MTYYLCPVCGYDRLEEPPEDWSICPCCLTQFEFWQDAAWYATVRTEWIAEGAKWESLYVPPPSNWNAIAQLLNIGYEVTPAERAMIEGREDWTVGLLTGLDQLILTPVGANGPNHIMTITPTVVIRSIRISMGASTQAAAFMRF